MHIGALASFAEAKDDLAWQGAMEQELTSVEQNRTWELVHLLPSHPPISLKGVLKLRKNELVAVIKHKARLVAWASSSKRGLTTMMPLLL